MSGGARIEVVKTYLEITDLADLRPPERPPERPFDLERVSDPDLNRWFYEHVGADHYWVDRLRWTDGQWADWERRVETWVVIVEGERAGYFELEPYSRGRLVQLAYFGLLKHVSRARDRRSRARAGDPARARARAQGRGEHQHTRRRVRPCQLRGAGNAAGAPRAGDNRW